MRVEAQRGDEQYLIDLEDGTGFVFDAEIPRAHPPMDINAIYGRGYWDDFEGDEDAEGELLALVRKTGVPKALRRGKGVG